MKNLIYLILLLLPVTNLSAQKTMNAENKHQISIELGGSSLIYSLNYERLLSKKKAALSLRVGFTAIPIPSKSVYRTTNEETEYDNFMNTGIGTPIKLLANWGKKQHKLELGIGYTPLLTFEHKRVYEFDTAEPLSNTISSEPVLYNLIAPSIGYRLDRDDKPFVFKAGVSFITLMRGLELGTPLSLPYPSMSLGWKIRSWKDRE